MCFRIDESHRKKWERKTVAYKVMHKLSPTCKNDFESVCYGGYWKIGVEKKRSKGRTKHVFSLHSAPYAECGIYVYRTQRIARVAAGNRNEVIVKMRVSPSDLLHVNQTVATYEKATPIKEVK